MEQENRRDYVATTDEDETELVRVEYEEEKHDEQRRKNLDLGTVKDDVYPSDINSPSNSSEDGIHTFKSNKPGRKTDRQRIECGQRREWTDSEILQLIQYWRENDILYNTNHPLYYVQTERKLALDNISTELQISIKDVSDKMHSLRTYYCSQRQRLEALNVEHGETVQVSRWKFYDQMSFLYESVTNRAVKSSMSGKSRRKKEYSKPEHPFPYKHQDLVKNSPPRIFEAMYAVPYDENMTLVEPRVPNTEYRIPSTEESATKRITIDDTTLGKRRLQDTPMYYPITEANEQPLNIAKKESPPLPRETSTSSKVSSKSDDIFGSMVANSLGQIEDEQQKELLKLNIQTLIYNVRFRKTTSK